MDDVLIALLCLTGCVFGTSSGAKLRGRTAYRAFRAGLGETGLVPDRLLPPPPSCSARARRSSPPRWWPRPP